MRPDEVVGSAHGGNGTGAAIPAATLRCSPQLLRALLFGVASHDLSQSGRQAQPPVL